MPSDLEDHTVAKEAAACLCAHVFVYELHTEDHDMHITKNGWTFGGIEDKESGPQTFKGLLGALRLKSNIKVRVGVS